MWGPFLANTQAGAKNDYRKVAVQTEILVIGGGPAGLSAALAASKYDTKVMLVEERKQLGGMLRYQTHGFEDVFQYKAKRGFQIADDMARSVEGNSQIDLLTDAKVFGYFADGIVGIWQGKTLYRCVARNIIVATGAYERPMLFTNNDLPGVIQSSAVQILLHRFGIRPGQSVVVATTNDYGYRVARNLEEAEVRVVAVADSRESNPRSQLHKSLLSKNIPIFQPFVVREAKGVRCVREVVVEPVVSSRSESSSIEQLRCDTVCTAAGFTPAVEILAQAGASISLTSNGPMPKHDEHMRVKKGLYVAGNAAGIKDLYNSILDGWIAGLTCVVDIGTHSDEAKTVREEYLQMRRSS